MPVGITPDTFNESSYLTIQEYKDAPTSIDINNLVVGGNQAAQDAELANVILRASSYMNEYLNQSLIADRYTETQRCRMTNNGYIPLHPYTSNIIALESFQYGTDPNNLITLPDPSVCWFEPQQIIVPLSQISTTYSSAGPLSFGYSAPRAQIYCKYTYVAGFVSTTIAANSSIGATSLTVASGIGIVAGQQLRIYDGANSETVIVASNYTYGSTTVPLAAATTYAHTVGDAIGNVPNAIRQACILITTAFLRVRGDKSTTMAITTRPTESTVAGGGRYGSEIALALDMVNKYRRVR